ncbi:MAG TPA: hypothetical protein DEU95_06370 [Chloroflexi bacterium]|jgi:hypothetical protein|nr:hypothetical protein [Chloroflexota bacterium]HCG29361.1 hypothetical protein [Chloroflexota bacterium]
MTYTADTSILGRGTASAEAVQAWFAEQGKRYAPTFGPKGQYVPPPAGLGQAILDECQRYTGMMVNWDMVAGQICHETAGWESVYARERNNPGGIGAINSDPDQAIRFPTVAAGVRAHVAHLLVYAVGEGPWRTDDPRYDAVRKAGWVGIAKRWRDLNGRWAFPGLTYSDMIASLANRLVSFANDGPWKEQQPMADVPIVQMLLPASASNTPRKPLVAAQYITIHETANPTRGADAVMHGKWLLNLAASGAGEPSWHYTVDDHQVVQHLTDDRAGWHAGDGANGVGNMQSIGIELCVNSDGNMQATRENAAWLVRRLMARHGIPVERVVQHNHWSGKDCPTQLRRSGWTEFVASLATAPPVPPAGDYREFPEAGHGIGGGFLWFWEHNGGLPIFGFPLTDEIAEDGQTVQYFERAVFEYHPENDEPYRVLLRRLGAEALARKEASA